MRARIRFRTYGSPRRYSTDSGCFAKTPVRERFPRYAVVALLGEHPPRTRGLDRAQAQADGL